MYEDSSSESESNSEIEEYSDNEKEDAGEKTAVLRNQLADIPLGQLKELKSTLGIKKYNEAIFGISGQNKLKEQNEFEVGKSPTGFKNPNDKTPKVTKRKGEPELMSSKKKPYKNKPRQVVANNKPRSQDPRFSDLYGHYNEQLFEKSYSFVSDIKDKEYEIIKKKIKKTKDSEKRQELVHLKKKIESQRKRNIEVKRRQEKIKERKTDEIGKVKSGKKAFYLKKSDQKKIELAEKYRELKSSGKFENYMKNKRKRKATKEKKKMLP